MALGAVVFLQLLLAAGVPIPPLLLSGIYAIITFLAVAATARYFADLIRSTGFPSPSTSMTSLRANVNISATFHAPARFAQRDYLYGGYRGKVTDIGLMY